jgi:hypothetical protein
MAYSPVNTYDERKEKGSVKEDLWDIITNVDPTEFQLQSGLGTVAVGSVYHGTLKHS